MPSRLPLRLAATCLSAPWLACCALGLTAAWLDPWILPGAALASIPATAGWYGIVLVVIGGAIASRVPAARPTLALVGFWALLALAGPVLAATRPLGLLVLIGPAVSRAPSAPWPPPPWWSALALWPAAAALRPFGPGVPAAVLDPLAALADSVPWPQAVVLGACVALAVMLGRSWTGSPRGALVGAGLALLATGTFGIEDAWLSSAAIGAVAGAWPVRRRGFGAALLTVTLLAGLRLGMVERWRCSALDDSRLVRRLLPDTDVEQLAIVPGNLPYLLASTGSELLRFSTTGTVIERRAVTPPGGLLTSSAGAEPTLLRVVGGESPRAQWFAASTLELQADVGFTGPCEPRDLALDGRTAWIACGDRLVGVDRGGRSWTLDAPALRVRSAGGLVLARVGRLWPRLLVVSGERVVDSIRLGPLASDANLVGDRLVVARGLLGQVELRGRSAAVPGLVDLPEPGSEQASRQALRHVLDRTRVMVWPSSIEAWPDERSFYAWSSVDARILRVDLDVPWHRHFVRVGAPPQLVVADPGSGTLYGLNRCGVFELRIPSVFPWASTGDVEQKVGGSGP